MTWEKKPNSPSMWNKKPQIDIKLCHICLGQKKTKEYDKLDLCNECMDTVISRGSDV
jgi:hypothetical protein